MLKKETEITSVHLAGGGRIKKVVFFFKLMKGGSKCFAACDGGGGQKSLMLKIFNCPAHPTKVFMNTPLVPIFKKKRY